MNILIAESRDQALLTMVIQEADKAEEKSSYIGRTALQKIMYFLKILGVPMVYRFEIYHYGPFCDEILNDTEILIADEVIKDTSQNPSKYSNYIPDINAQELLDKHETLEKYRDKVKIVVKALIPCEPEQLELISTLDYLYRWFKASGKTGPWKEKVVTRFQEIKNRQEIENRYDTKTIEKNYDILAKAGLIEE